MSRFGEGEYEPVIDKNGREINTSGLYQGALRAALRSRRGRAALAELREALMALPEHRLIEGALCTVGLGDRIAGMPYTKVVEREPRLLNEDGSVKRGADGKPLFGPAEAVTIKNYERELLVEYLVDREDQPEGVCAVGAYVWWQKVKAGMDPAAAFADMPVLPDTAAGEWDTAWAGRDAGLTETLAMHLAYMNDERFYGLTPEERWQKVVDAIDQELRREPLSSRADP